MPTVYVLPEQKPIECRAAEALLDAALREGVGITHACGGEAQCSTCRVVVVEGLPQCLPRTPEETVIAERLEFPDEFRLACQLRVEGNVTVRRLVIDEEDAALVDVRPEFARRDPPKFVKRMFGGFTRRRALRRPVGSEQPVAVLFSDIRGFTPFAEALLPYDVIHVLERHLREVSESVTENDGVVASMMGDGVMALFGLDDGDRAVHDAVRAGLEILDRVDASRERVEAWYGRSFDVNVGIHYGPAIVGRLWGDEHAVTAMGDVVNMASRVEQANKETGTRLLLTAAAFEQVADVAVAGQSLCCTLPGKQGEHDLVEVVGIRGSDRPDS